MLKSNLELIVQYPEENGAYACRGFRKLQLTAPAFVVFDGAKLVDQRVAALLGKAFCQEILRYVGVEEETSMPCQGIRPAVSCHAVAEPTCRKILVRPAGNQPLNGDLNGSLAAYRAWPTPSAEPIWLDGWPKANWEVIPIMPAGTTPADHLPLEWQGINASFWKQDATESLWPVIQRAGLAPQDSRIFISYVRRDTTAIADQLFAALTEEGFDVFLDRSSVPVGVQFQERLMQDLVDKAMVVFLNSPGVAQSKWVGEEIATIKLYRLGLLELRFPDVEERKDIDPDLTRTVHPGDLKSAGTDYGKNAKKLSDKALGSIVEQIKETHGRALHRRRYQLIDSFAAALADANRQAQVLSDGTFVLPPSGSNSGAVVGLTTRLPELGDFCSLHQRGGISANLAGWLISPSPFFVAQRQAHVSWLGGLSNVHHANEAQIAQLATTL